MICQLWKLRCSSVCPYISWNAACRSLTPSQVIGRLIKKLTLRRKLQVPQTRSLNYDPVNTAPRHKLNDWHYHLCSALLPGLNHSANTSSSWMCRELYLRLYLVTSYTAHDVRHPIKAFTGCFFDDKMLIRTSLLKQLNDILLPVGPPSIILTRSTTKADEKNVLIIFF